MSFRSDQLKNLMDEKNLEAFIVDATQNLFYLTGFTGTSGKLLFTPDHNYLLTDFRYSEQAEQETNDFEIIEIDETYSEKIGALISRENIKKIGFEAKEVSYSQYQKYLKQCDDIKLIATRELVEQIRVIKEKNEINKIKKAVEITDKAFNHILDFIKPGLTEREIGLELEFFMKKHGGSKNAFDFIVASGKRSSLPHGVATPKPIAKGDFITIDFGTKYQGYCSDMTRTVVLGSPTSFQSEIYELVRKAQLEVIKEIRPGMTAKQIDNIARNIIKKAGYGDNFKHSLGHSLGIEVHEKPQISYKSEKVIKPGMVITDEPGIYISDWGGVRIEDDLLITENGCEVLNNSTKDLISI